jgi:hypothetical protein
MSPDAEDRIHHLGACSDHGPQCAPRLLGFYIAVRPNRPPHGHVRRDWWIGIRVTVQGHVIPAQGAGLLGPAASQEAEHDAGVQP